MTITQVIQAAPAKANELFAKLTDTSDGAVKTREKLLGELREELELQARLEEKHLFPVLRKHKELQALVTEAIADNKEALSRLAELERMPKDSDDFAKKVAELRKIFQQHVRDDRKELLPAIRKVLSDEESKKVTERIEAGKAEIEESRREEAEQRRAAARKENEEAERLEAEARAQANQVREASVAMARTAGKTVRSGAEVVKAGAEAGAELAGKGTDAALHGTRQALGTTRRIATPAIDGIETFACLPGVAAAAVNDAGRAWADWLDTTTRAGVRGSQELAHSASPQRIAEVQGRVMNETIQAWFNVGARLFEIAIRAQRDTLKPIQRQTERLKDAA